MYYVLLLASSEGLIFKTTMGPSDTSASPVRAEQLLPFYQLSTSLYEDSHHNIVVVPDCCSWAQPLRIAELFVCQSSEIFQFMLLSPDAFQIEVRT